MLLPLCLSIAVFLLYVEALHKIFVKKNVSAVKKRSLKAGGWSHSEVEGMDFLRVKWRARKEEVEVGGGGMMVP